MRKKLSINRNDTPQEQFRKMGYRAGLRDAIVIAGMAWAAYPNATLKDLGMPVRDAVLNALERKLREATDE